MRARTKRKPPSAREQTTFPLLVTPPPYEPYEDWLVVGDQGIARTEMTTALAEEAGEYVGQEAEEVMATLLRLAPLYDGRVPLAAVYLDMQIFSGEFYTAVPDHPDLFRTIPVADVADGLSHRERLAELTGMRTADFPADEEPARPVAAAEIADSLHALHRSGYLILDNEHLLHFAQPPARPGGDWRIDVLRDANI